MSEKDWKDYFICTGPDSILVPVIVKPEEDWRAAHNIEHDNLQRKAFGHPCLAQHHPLSLTSYIFGGNMLEKSKFSEGPFLKQE
nr:photosynthetic ndh subunit of subcomplex b 2, chloroplastic [Quercus suber]